MVAHAWVAAVAADSAHPDAGPGPSAHSPGKADTALAECRPLVAVERGINSSV